MKRNEFKMNRRQILKAGFYTGTSMMIPWQFNRKAYAVPAAEDWGLSDPALQPKFVNRVPDALDPGFIYKPDRKGRYKIKIGATTQSTGLLNSAGVPVDTPIWGYGDVKDGIITWPGRTFEIQSGVSETEVYWSNQLAGISQHLLPVDTNLHWCYSLHGYTKNSIAKSGVPIITHLHGGHTDFQFDGNPEFFYSPIVKNKQVVGPQWENVPDGFTTKFRYDNNVKAGNLWYHDHALGLTRLNVYAGLAGFYFIQDEMDTGKSGNPLTLPAWPYEKAYAIQDRMFKENGELFYSAFLGDPFYADFIAMKEDGETPDLPADLFPPPGYGPTALAEFFGDHMVVNGMIWPREDVEPTNYRLHLLNGTDSRFMVIRFREARAPGSDSEPVTDLIGANPELIEFYVIGSDQGLAAEATLTDTLVCEPGGRYDIVFDFKDRQGQRIIMENIGGDAPFGGEYGGSPPEFNDFFPDRQTDRIMAFDVGIEPDIEDQFEVEHFNNVQSTMGPIVINSNGVNPRIRKVALFEGMDEFGRLQPLLGTAEPATDFQGDPINWPNTEVYSSAGLTDQMEGAIAWHSPTTENPAYDPEGVTEIWEIWNITGDAHPVHLHLVHFEVLDRQEIKWDPIVNDDGFIPDGSTPEGNGIYLVSQPTVQHNSVAGDLSTYGKGFKIVHPTNPDDAYGAVVPQPVGYVENTPKDMVTALPGQITKIKATFDKPGRYVWHCHILSHEDHEMMRVLHIGPGD